MMTDGSDSEPVKARSFPPNAIHLVRTTQQIHVQLSAMADHKASILMGATFVIFTITIGQARQASPPIALLILGASAFFSAVFAVLAILPATHYKQVGPINLLFFGSFTRLSEKEYLDKIVEQLGQDESIYRTMSRDIYQNGVVLERKKYRMLGYAYRIFLAGLTASFLAFLAETLIWYR
ncbi:MAG TPA: Pycsar system effector family protein [Allosphingosinicella sp.]|jgi:hypothetical protein|uniref:Pycsar system effector family protein n=1 Tax=Allosphingosinicella sp. TaxID=2823234 RepID=UPI002F29FBCF